MKIGIVITVRSGSTRLPQKALMQVNHIPMIGYLIKRLQKIRQDNSEIVICTTDLEEDTIFDDIAKQYKTAVFHGDSINIIKRHLQCARARQYDFLVNIDGDDILTNPDYVQKIMENADNMEYEVFKSIGLPFGTNSIGYRKEVLEHILSNCSQKSIETGWGELVSDKRAFKIMEFLSKQEEKMAELRLTLDYEEDFQLFRHLIEELFLEDKIPSQEEIMLYLHKNPELLSLNSHLTGVYWENFEHRKEEEKNDKK